VPSEEDSSDSIARTASVVDILSSESEKSIDPGPLLASNVL